MKTLILIIVLLLSGCITIKNNNQIQEQVETTKSYMITPKQYIVIQQMAKVNHRWYVQTSNVIDDKMYVLSYNAKGIIVLRATPRVTSSEEFKLLNLYTELTKEQWEALGIGYDEYINNIKLNKQRR